MTTTLVEALLAAMGLDQASIEHLKRYELDVLRSDQARRAHQITKLVLREHLKRIGRRFDGEIPFLLLKGEPLEEILFANKMARSTGDLDLLVYPKDFPAAAQALQDLGYTSLLNEPPRSWAQNQQAFIHHRQPVLVELHWSCALPGVPQLPVNELFKTSQPYHFDDELTVQALRPDWLFFHLILHFHHHLGFAKGLLDIAAWCDRYGMTYDLDRLAHQATALGMEGLVQWPLHTLFRLVGPLPPLPQMVDLDAEQAVHFWSRLSARALKGCLEQYDPDALSAALNGMMHDLPPLQGLSLQALSMLLLDGWPEKARGFCRPFLLGPHRLGRMVARWRLRIDSLPGARYLFSGPTTP